MIAIFDQTSDTLFFTGECIDGSEMLSYVFGDDINYFCLSLTCEHYIIYPTYTAHNRLLYFIWAADILS